MPGLVMGISGCISNVFGALLSALAMLLYEEHGGFGAWCFFMAGVLAFMCIGFWATIGLRPPDWARTATFEPPTTDHGVKC